MRLIFTFIGVFLLAFASSAQEGRITGRVYDAENNEPLPFANVAIQNSSLGAVTDTMGNYSINGLAPGVYNVLAGFVGYRSKTIFEVQVLPGRSSRLDIPMAPTTTNLQTVEIKAAPFDRDLESPVSLQEIGADEIRRNPGGNRDISRAMQVLPGVASSLSFRNDIIIRGGAPNENAFYLDGIEVPVINHFSTQGSSGGPIGIINVDFIKRVDFYSGAFPANRENALSAVLEFDQKDGNTEELRTQITLGASDLGLTLDGPLSPKTTFLFSARRSYLQFLFDALGLPFLPTYNDAQFKVSHRFNQRNELTVIGLGAYDTFKLNAAAVESANGETEKRTAQYLLDNLPINEQWNYTVGAHYKNYFAKGRQSLVASRSHLNNTTTKDASGSMSDDKVLDYRSEEIENNFRYEYHRRSGEWKYFAGMGLGGVTYTNATRGFVPTDSAVVPIDFDSRIDFLRFSVFGQIGRGFYDQRLLVSAGVRSDWNDFAPSMNQPLDQFSPRISASYALTPSLSISANVGRYHQLPAYTILGYRDNSGALVNKVNGTEYIRSDHYVTGLKYILPKNTKISVEGFYKKYHRYPVSLRTGVSLANLGADYGVIGNEPVSSTGRGRAYGLEFLVQRKLYNGLFGIAALTLVRSEFTNQTDEYLPSSWDNRYILSLTAGKMLPKNWEVGTRFRLLGGMPYTPADRSTTALKDVWAVTGGAVPDYDRLNTERTSVFYQLDLRVDKKFYFENWSLNLYFDIENLTNASTEFAPYLDVVRGTDEMPITDPEDPSRYLLTTIPNTSGTVLPTLGVVIEF